MTPLPSSSWIVADEKLLVELPTAALNPPMVNALVVAKAATAAREAMRPRLFARILLRTFMPTPGSYEPTQIAGSNPCGQDSDA